MNCLHVRDLQLCATALVVAALTLPATAQQRELQPLLAGVDVKTAPEPSRPPDFVAARPAVLTGPAAQARDAAGDHAPTRTLDPRAPIAGALRVDHSIMHYDAPGDGSLWARGATYKASFDEAGATYFPLFGGRQPRHLPLALSPDAVTVGETALEIGAAPAATLNEDRVELDRGSFVERYELAPQCVEQVFVFPALPVAGELVVRIPIAPVRETIDVVETATGLEISSELGRVSYGRAVAIDATGRRTDAATAFADGAITIRVDAAFVATSTMPLMIDPIVTTFPIDTTSYDDQAPDVAYDATTQRWLVVFQESATAGDQDVYYTMLNAAGASMWGGYVNSNNASWWWASCANLNSADQFLVACNVYSNGAYTIRGRTIQAAVFGIGNEFLISGSEQGDKVRPDVGGDPYLGLAYYCVAYEREYSSSDHDILVRCVTSSSTLVGTSAVYLSNSGSTYDTQPSIAKSNGAGNWMIAWARTPNGSSSDIWAGSVSYGGNTVLSPFQITAGGYDWYASVSSPMAGSQLTMIAFLRDYGPDYDVFAYVQNGTTPIAQANISTLHNDVHFLKDQQFPNVDCDGQHFLVGYSEQHSTGFYDYDVYVDDVYLSGNTIALAQEHMPLAVSTLREVGPRVASTYGSGGPARRFLMAWSKESASGNHDVYGGLFDSHVGGTSMQFCRGDATGGVHCPCGNNGSPGHGCANSVLTQGAILTVSGTLSPASDTAVLHAADMPATAACLFFQGTQIGFPAAFGDGLRCATGSVLRVGTKSAVGGAAIYPGPGDPALHTAGSVPAGGGQRTYQVWYRNAASFCTSAPYNLTNGVIINWAN